MRTSLRASRFPTTARSTSSSTRPDCSWTLSSSIVIGARLIRRRDRGPDGDSAGQAVVRGRAIGPNQVERLVSEDASCALGLAVEVEVVPRSESLGCEHSQSRTHPNVEVERVCGCEYDLLLEPCE